MTRPYKTPSDYQGLRIVILEDNVLLSERMKRVLSSWGPVKTIYTFPDNASFLEHLSNNPVDILLADLNLNDGPGFTSIRAHVHQHPNGIAIVISILSDGETVFNAITAGAVGYIDKNDTSLKITKSIEMALEGKAPISASLARVMITHMHGNSVNQTVPKTIDAVSAPKPQNHTLTHREVEVLKLIAKGLTNSECAQVLGISSQTIPVHARNIFKKLQTNNRSEAVYEARTLGMID